VNKGVVVSTRALWRLRELQIGTERGIQLGEEDTSLLADDGVASSTGRRLIVVLITRGLREGAERLQPAPVFGFVDTCALRSVSSWAPHADKIAISMNVHSATVGRPMRICVPSKGRVSQVNHGHTAS
jgi:hypothetical protein